MDSSKFTADDIIVAEIDQLRASLNLKIETVDKYEKLKQSEKKKYE